jgi:hypothetical protein
MEARPGGNSKLINNLKPNKIMKKSFTAITWLLLVTCCFNSVHAQDVGTSKKTSIVAWDGMVVAGYVDRGAYVNFGGPSIKFINKPWSLAFGILPTMRIKEDKVAKGQPRNSVVMPTAGFGLTFVYRHLVLQIPLYYNNKTTASSGKWNPGLGLGYKF